VTWRPTGPTTGVPAVASASADPAASTRELEALGIDEVLPRFDVNVVQHVVVNADPVTTYHALLRADLAANPVVTLLVRIRDLPNRLRHPQHSKRPHGRFTLADAVASDFGWVRMRDEPGVELLAGLVGKFWRRDYEVVTVQPEEFAGFARPGYAKTVAALSMRPYGRDRTLLSYESRTATTDARSRRLFAAYWFVLRPFVTQLLRAVLVAAKQEAEQTRTRSPLSDFAPLDPPPAGTDDDACDHDRA
jgi:hypothetical protein